MNTTLYNSSFPNFSSKKRPRMPSNKVLVNEKKINLHGDGAPPKKRRSRAQSFCIPKKRVTFSTNIATFHSEFLASEAPTRISSRAYAKKSSHCPYELASEAAITKMNSSSTFVNNSSGGTHLASPALSPSSYSLLRQSLENDIKCLETVLLCFSMRKGVQSSFQDLTPGNFKHHSCQDEMDHNQQKMVVKRAFAVLKPIDKMIYRRLNTDETDALLQLTNMRYLNHRR